MRIFIIVTVCSFLFHARAQNDTDSMVFYFDVNAHWLNVSEMTRFNKYFDHYQADNANLINIYGHTDSVGSFEDNLLLSSKRCRYMHHLLKQKLDSLIVINEWPKGESINIKSNATSHGRSLNRRVKIVFASQSSFANYRKDKENTYTQKVTMAACHDTTLYLSSTLVAKMNACTYDKHKNCLRFKDYTNIENIRNTNLITETVNGEPLMSAGMFGFETCDGKPLKDPIKFLIPINACNDIFGMNLYNRMNNRWIRSQNDIKRVEINGQAYYEYAVQEPGIYNFDVLMGRGRREPKHIIKAKDGYRIIQVHFSGSCPMYAITVYPERGKGEAYGYPVRKVKIRFCPSSTPEAKITAITPIGDTLVADYQSIKAYEAKTTIRRCKLGGGMNRKERRKNTILARRHKVFPEHFRRFRPSTNSILRNAF